jgi:rod shape-determining protein MreC
VLKFKRKRLTYSAFFCLFIILLSVFTVFLRKPASEASKYPLGFYALIKRELAGIIFYHRNLTQNEVLKREVDLLKNRMKGINEVYLENERLKKLLSFKQKSSYKLIVARIIGRSADNWSSVVMIDKGSFNGIRPGFVVIAPQGLVGRVAETTNSTSKVMLINDPNFGVSAIVQRSRQEGLVSGTLGQSLIMKYLPKDSDIQVSDMINTSGLTSTFPKGLVIGGVINIGEEFSGLSRYAIIRPAVNLSSIEEVLIIIP